MARIALLAGGGGAPGAEEVLAAAAVEAARAGGSCIGIRGGFPGLLASQSAPFEGGPLGSGASPGLRNPAEIDRAAAAFRALGADGMVVVGGEGSLQASTGLAKAGVPVVFVPAAVENDVAGTDVCLGVDTALNGILQAAEARDRPAILEVPGRFTGYLALMGAVVARAAGALVVERPFPWDRLEARLKEGARPLLLRAEGAGASRDAETRFRALLPGRDPRVDSLGPALRVRPPSAFDRLAASRCGEAAAASLLGGAAHRMIAWRAGVCLPVPMEEAAGRRRQVAPEVFEAAKKAGVVFE